MKSPTPETQCAQGIYQMQYPICAKYQGQADHDTTFANS